MAPAGPIGQLVALAGAVGALPARLVGPIFTKELRVSSRRRRNYVLRGVYLAILTTFVTLVWLGAVKWSTHGSHAYRIAHLERAGRTIISCVVWFQFVAVLLVTVIMLSTSISEEIYHRTLGVLMTTPINSFQVVIGKLLSKMLQLVVLLAMSLPLLAVVRVLGGVPWYYVVSGLCITLTTGIFFASVTMFFSILFRRAFVSILLSLGAMGLLYLGLPLIVALALAAADVGSPSNFQPLLTLLLHYNPFVALSAHTVMVFEPRAPAALGVFYWWGNCLVSLGLSAGVLAACVAMVRRVALRQAGGAAGAGPSPAPAPTAVAPPPVLAPAGPAEPPPAAAVPAPPPIAPPPPRPVPAKAAIRRVTGSPIIWRELRARWMRRKLLLWILLGVGLALLVLVYGLVASIDNGFEENEVHAVFLCAFMVLGILTTCVLAATSITSEKEANSWEILLCTTLSDRHILLGKAVGIARRCLPVWLLPVAHVLLFMALGLAHVVLLGHLLIVVTGLVALLAGTGLYFGVRFRRTTTTVILNLTVALGLWAGLPLLSALASEALPRGLRNEVRNLTEYLVDINPVYQVGLVTEQATGPKRATRGPANLRYYWEGAGRCDLAETTLYLLLCAGAHLGLGTLFAWRAQRRLRRRRY